MTKKLSTFSFDWASLWTGINESTNVARWNPALAISWMEDIQAKLTNFLQLEAWDKAARDINTTIDQIESAPYYDPEYWGKEKPRRLALLGTITKTQDEKIHQLVTNLK